MIIIFNHSFSANLLLNHNMPSADCLLQRNKFKRSAASRLAKTIRVDAKCAINFSNSIRFSPHNAVTELARDGCCTINSENHSHTCTTRMHTILCWHKYVLALIFYLPNTVFFVRIIWFGSCIAICASCISIFLQHSAGRNQPHQHCFKFMFVNANRQCRHARPCISFTLSLLSCCIDYCRYISTVRSVFERRLCNV